MADGTKIEWADATFNPWIGCTKVSPACDHCYASVSTPARALGVAWGPGQPRRRTSAANWKLPLRWEREHAAFYAEHGHRRRVFCASLSDVFDNEVPDEWRRDLFELIATTPNLDWLLLTKRVGNVSHMVAGITDRPRTASHSGDLLAHHWRNGNAPANVWLGATIANQAEADRDIPKLLAMPARVRFLSMEPLLGPVDLRVHIYSEPTGRFRTHHGKRQLELQRPADGGLHWVIVGGESGPHARPAHPNWYRDLRDQCAAAGVPFLFKQWGEWATYDRGRTDGATLASPFSLDRPLQRFGKKAAGRMLDGREHNGFPLEAGKA